MKVKVALLEDDGILLADHKNKIEETGLAEVIVFSDNSQDFIRQVEEKSAVIKALVLDIELDGDSMSGLEVASLLKKPVLFISGKFKDKIEYLNGIEAINLDNEFPVEFILKPATPDRLKKILEKLFDQIYLIEKREQDNFILLDINGINTKKPQSTIAFIESVPDGSNNKNIFFTDEKPSTLYNFSYTKMFEKGFDIELFIQPHQSYRVNKKLIKGYDQINHELLIEYLNEENKSIEKRIPVSENYRTKIKNYLKNR
ncbi:MAG: LytTR family transcriptional regulator DNA-binding domain-containing protein [Flavobacteriia bacterium]|nr:LytTR family transcriptional regulator DNA-binding domain-containing protein [Flavobacteriia bacterium]OJX35338.1 MAG: hypothetical protein BGO87_12085 [Flavobacteriia bacterium 40-80]